MRTSVYLSFVWLMAMSLTGCTPTQYTQLRPVSGPVIGEGGRAITKASADSVEVVASFERLDLEYLAFDVEVKNNTAAPLAFDPVAFQADLLTADHQPFVSGPSAETFRTAADPIYEEGRADRRMKKEDARLKRAKILNTVLFVAIAASEIASSVRPTGNYRDWANRQNNHNLAYNFLMTKRIIDHGVFASRLQRYQFEQYRWKQLALTRADIQPGQSVRGFIYVPAVKGASFVRLTYPTPAGGSVEMLFEQTNTKFRPREAVTARVGQ